MTGPTITGIEAVPLRIPFDHWAPKPQFAGRPRETLDTVLIRVTTDAGLVGWGEAYGSFWSAVTAAVDEFVAPLAIGQRTDDTGLPERIERTLHNLGRTGPTVHAISGLDIALWDLRGKAAGVPVSTLLGGRRRDRIPVYASLLQYYGEADRLRHAIDRALAAGFSQIKLHERTVAAVAAARAAAGPGVPIMVDTNCAWLPGEATAPVAAMAESDILWIEEPIWPPEDFSALAELRRATGVPTAIGENAGTALDFGKMRAADCVDYVQPSVIKIGGLTPLWRICREAEAAGLTCVPHSPFFGPGYLATIHVLAAKVRAVAIERFYCDLAFDPCGPFVPIVDGHIAVPEAPGLGGDPDPELIATFRA
ncbi:mandelate racemase/muconate lactonizing enzyme family protein [Rhodoplanes sp. TEM]|uniref:Mandelate racemase/muconate lactonizing enzyme family protein n=1 Tax=Rhodoplanes tepidamans TaxID=200616 RepID=A0ABT5J4A7_RHOTP|nr:MULTISPECIES: mandelate racemase/muconate lactonizing enzyme family protein [Rhodoplanes]MDC7784448.1 mandelate racemase/muconate lactonizing enzyme family protein [Rhodoplanes tepidamans]MDC7983478.1 mandelate racemase/muconate lactonizing enzyme family protein [Rhodoplanes sp. TEM]MDQ0356955.1 L-alanine-DL-glutamate epimerase-like enolase superfamily enzyme [Rhodoplanes tepidamans]